MRRALNRYRCGQKCPRSYGLFIRHAKGIVLNNVEFSVLNRDDRSAILLDDVKGADLRFVTAETTTEPSLVVRDSRDIRLFQSLGQKDLVLTDASDFNL